MRARIIVIGNVGAQEPAEVAFVEHEDVVEALAADGADRPLHEGVLPGCAWGGEDLADPHVLDVPHELLAVDTVTIMKQVGRSRIIRERLDELPGGPGCRGMGGDVEVDEFTSVAASSRACAARKARHVGDGRGEDRCMLSFAKSASESRGRSVRLGWSNRP